MIQREVEYTFDSLAQELLDEALANIPTRTNKVSRGTRALSYQRIVAALVAGGFVVAPLNIFGSREVFFDTMLVGKLYKSRKLIIEGVRVNV